MPKLNEGNCSIDKNSGAVMYHKSPELKELIELRKEVKQLSKQLDEITKLLKGGVVDGK